MKLSMNDFTRPQLSSIQAQVSSVGCRGSNAPCLDTPHSPPGRGSSYEPGPVAGLLARLAVLLLMLLPVAAFAEVTPYPPYPGAVASDSYKVAVNGQPVFVHRFLTYDQFNWMDYASFSMTGKVHVEVTCLVSQGS